MSNRLTTENQNSSIPDCRRLTRSRLAKGPGVIRGLLPNLGYIPYQDRNGGATFGCFIVSMATLVYFLMLAACRSLR